MGGETGPSVRHEFLGAEQVIAAGGSGLSDQRSPARTP
jgi:hypothetical protein